MNNYETLYNIGHIYEMFGDTQAAIRFLQSAGETNPNSELDKKITRLRNSDRLNQEYYSNTRIH